MEDREGTSKKESLEEKSEESFSDIIDKMKTTMIPLTLVMTAKTFSLAPYTLGDMPGFLGEYMGISIVSDLLEFSYRLHVKGADEQGLPYSCFERHIFYDIPKAGYNLVKKGVRKMQGLGDE